MSSRPRPAAGRDRMLITSSNTARKAGTTHLSHRNGCGASRHFFSRWTILAASTDSVRRGMTKRRLIETMCCRAELRLATDLPRSHCIIRGLANDYDIEVAGPVLQHSEG